MYGKIGEMLVEAELITKEQLDEALRFQEKNGGRLGYNLLRLGFIEEQQIISFLSKQLAIPSVDLNEMEIEPEVMKLIPADVAHRYQVIPLSRTGTTLTIAMSDPTNVFAIDDIRFITGYNIEPRVSSDLAIRHAIEENYDSTTDLALREVIQDYEAAERDTAVEILEEELVDVKELEQLSEDAPVVRLVNLILSEGLKKEASDVHIEPYEKSLRVRYRIDGILYEVMNPPMKLKNAIVSCVKIMAKLDIAERRLPQDGRIKIKMALKGNKKEVDVRVSVLPTLFGEKVVMRLLDPAQLRLDMTKLGFEASSLKKFNDVITRPYGMVLVTGPTGSGKTNTLYSALSTLNSPEINIITAEDPIEFNLKGINQVQMKDQIGLNFASSLRAFLRQDPNIIMVGEIRDFETAEIAIKAALTGHLVLSTVHTNDAPSTINRLMNMGLEPYLVASSVLMIAAQRLVRRICSNCKDEVNVPLPAVKEIGFSDSEASEIQFYQGKGCAQCNQTGYRGRIGLFEAMPLTTGVRELILCGASTMEIRDKAIEEGMLTLRHSGLEKLRSGVTTIEEVLRETVK